MYFLFSFVFTSSSTEPPRQCLAPTCHLSTLNEHFIAGAGLHIHMIGEVSRFRGTQIEDERG
jgi:hypothetical protein